MKCISMVTVPVPWQRSHRPPTVLNENAPARSSRGRAAEVEAKSLRISS
jgi:hypothetical protein